MAHRQPLRSLVLVTSLSFVTGCFFDSRWIQQQEQRAAAVERAKPAELRPARESEIPAAKTARVLRVRAHATAKHAAEVVDWPKQLAATLDAAGEVLGPTLGIRLEVVSTETWAPRGGEEDLSGRLDELVALDDGHDVDWVIGLLGSLPRLEMAYHQLGMARMPGNHLVMRAMNDAREHEAIERGFTWLDAREKSELYKARKRHKATTVLLHELGHTLGALHEVDAESVMAPRYDPKVSGLSQPALGLMRIALAKKMDPAGQTGEAFLAAVVQHIERTPSVWVASERDSLLTKLRQAAPSSRPRSADPSSRGVAMGPQAPLPPPSASLPASDGDPLAAMNIADRNLYQKALAAKRGGQLREAVEMLKALLPSYPDNVAVQDLRCQIAMAAGGSFSDVQAECQKLMELTTGKK
jgi:hypothetical protein